MDGQGRGGVSRFLEGAWLAMAVSAAHWLYVDDSGKSLGRGL